MKKQLTLLVLTFTLQAPAQEQPVLPEPVAQEVPFDSLFDDPALNRFLNPSEQEEQYVYSIQQPPPPGTLLVWLRIIGVPIINAFFSVRRAVRESFAWILARIKNQKEIPAYEPR